MARTRLSLLKTAGTTADENGKKENDKHLSLLFRGYKHEQMEGEVSSLKCSLLSFFTSAALCAKTWELGGS